MNKGSEIMYYQLIYMLKIMQCFGMIQILFLELLKIMVVAGSDTRTIYGKILRNDIGARTGAFNIKIRSSEL